MSSNHSSHIFYMLANSINIFFLNSSFETISHSLGISGGFFLCLSDNQDAK